VFRQIPIWRRINPAIFAIAVALSIWRGSYVALGITGFFFLFSLVILGMWIYGVRRHGQG
jgi:hypothetical protein